MIAIIKSFYDERFANIDTIVKNLIHGSVVPEKIIVFNQGRYAIRPDHCEVFVSDANYGDRASYAVAMLNPHKRYFLIDDDVTVTQDTLKTFEEYYSEGTCLGTLGKKYVGKEYRDTPSIKSCNVTKLTEVDTLIGVGGLFLDYKAVKNLLEFETRIGHNWNTTRELDLIVSAINKSYIIPSKDPLLETLNEAGVGYHSQPGHYKKRDRVFQLLLGGK